MSTREGVSGSPQGFNDGSSGSDGNPRYEEHLAAFLDVLELSPDEIAFMDQVHGDRIAEATESGIYPATDAIVTQSNRLALTVRSADCAPILLYAPAEHTIAAIHAGWRGTASRITEKTVRHLVEEYGIETEYLFAYIGPAAKKCCYEVGEEVVEALNGQSIERHNGKAMVDLQELNRTQLLEAGLKTENIEIDDLCTIHNSVFHSHRRDGQKAGRMLALIYLNERKAV